MTKQANGRRFPKRSIAETRALMLHAATELVCARVQDTDEEAVAAALAHVRLTDVAAHATRIMREQTGDQGAAAITTGAIYQLWPTQAEFQSELLFHIAELDAVLVPDREDVTESAAAYATAGKPVGEALHATIERAFAYTRENPVYYVFLSFYIRSGNPRVRQALHQSYASFAPAAREAWQAMLDAYQLKIRAPHTIDDLATAMTALIEGFALRWVADPASTRPPAGEQDWSLVSTTALKLFEQFTEPTT
jgi:hypothetical protein